MKTPNTRGKKATLVVSLVVGAVLGGAVTAGLSVAAVIATGSPSATAVPTTTLSTSTSPTATTPPTASSVAPTATSSPAPTANSVVDGKSTRTTTTLDPAATRQILTNKSTQVTLSPTPAKTSTPGKTDTPAPTQPKACDPDKPAIWAACTKGYIAPRIEFVGLLSCTAVDRAAGTWSVVRGYRLVGGNYTGVDWGAKVNANGIATVPLRIEGIPENGLNYPLPISSNVTAYIKSMNGYLGHIDVIDLSNTSGEETVTLSTVCK